MEQCLVPAWMQLPAGGCTVCTVGAGGGLQHRGLGASYWSLQLCSWLGWQRRHPGKIPPAPQQQWFSHATGTVEPGSPLDCADAAPWSGTRCLFGSEPWNGLLLLGVIYLRGTRGLPCDITVLVWRCFHTSSLLQKLTNNINKTIMCPRLIWDFQSP